MSERLEHTYQALPASRKQERLADRVSPVSFYNMNIDEWQRRLSIKGVIKME
jgi:hypothetical protein